ncbi:exodeoxyribonuclease VII large subunit [uncultured Piscinibacter sp.]|uniref:exodeoxyribonuclease VII large subunit n=1 Tax=uncultured Piscinibacter sp. TaxID=1131835 RepID=UPI00263686A9|nr:exodeoxyribonuclease VII large subunit [uncultured Piscinibacter sp.]
MAESAAQAPGRLVWSVAGLVQAVSDALVARFPVCVVRGELSALMRASSGHCYFSLKDSDGAAALLRCAMFRRAAGLLDFAPADGQLVELRGRLAVYEPRGELQFIVEGMQRAGAGALFEQFLRLRAALEAQGLFDAERKRPIPAFPRRIGIVTSLAAAALHDVLTTLARRSPHVEVIVYPSLVQGAEAPASLVQALTTASDRCEVDTLLLCRGGGSLEDLWAFNDERVVRALAGCRVPVVCGVGHETDVTLADLAADLRAPTPTAAAELAAPATEACMETLAVLQRRATQRLHAMLDTQAQRLDSLSLRLTRPAEGVRARRQQLALLGQRLLGAGQHLCDRRGLQLVQLAQRLVRGAAVDRRSRERRLDAFGPRLDALDPQHVLARGYAWLTDGQGRVLHSVRQLDVGQDLHATLADGHAELSVVAVAAAARE